MKGELKKARKVNKIKIRQGKEKNYTEFGWDIDCKRRGKEFF